ncbi:MAG: carboxypeptidase regulatory-like domain-containing protein [Kangiellaceae bacterium]|nr:carboxypeptidase regulatory-like domain-containing protein [Kangiellaceae bacterium]
MKKLKFERKLLSRATQKALSVPIKTLSAVLVTGMLMSTPASAAQTGAIKGKVSAEASAMTGMTVTATSNIMPRPRTAVVKADGSYNLPLLLPGDYELTFKSASGAVKTFSVQVLLDQTANVSFVLGSDSVSDSNLLVITGSAVVREGDSGISTSFGEDVIKAVPIGQNYRDMLKLVPGVAYSELGTLGPNAGGSGRDNKYGFDGVDVSLPMFGNLSAEPSTHDIAQVSIDKGAAKAIGFNRSGGFAINTISKSGTNEFHGNVEYKLQNKNFVADRDNADSTEYTLDKTWLTTSLSGPIIEDKLFFYGSYHRPEVDRVNKETAYGPAKDYESVRNEYFGKLTYAPIDDALLNISYRTSDRTGRGQSVGGLDADSTSVSSDARQDIFTLDGSYIISDYTSVSFQYSQFDYETDSSPDTLLSAVPSVGAALDLGNLDQLGAFNVPSSGNFDPVGAQVLIDQYGYIGDDGLRHGGGQIGAGSTINNQNFYRDGFEMALDHEVDFGESTHRLHFGFSWKEGEEVLSRLSNGWGSISYFGGEELASDGVTPIYYRAITQQMSLQDGSGATVPGITSGTESYNFEINDTIEHGDFIYNVGILVSHDVLYGQGLKENSDNVSGYELAPGNKYKMYSVNWKDMIQPRLGVTWVYDEQDTLFANFASYNPEASSLARAASWARNTRSALNVDFDQNGNYIESEPRDGSSGKFFQEGIKPRRIDELTLGFTKAVTDELYIRTHIRRREGSHFWEDTWNGSRNYGEYGPFGGVPEHLQDAGDYIPELQSYRDEVGGSSYVIAELDDGYTSYNELAIEAEWKGDRTYLNASYTWSHYYGNFDQDNVSGSNDANLFIGSSNLADGRGRQLWDGKEGKLFGDKPHVFKAFGYYTTDWQANVGAYLVYQSGDVWEAWDGSVYGYSSSTIRNAETAGRRRGPSHWQLDLNYTQDFELSEDYTLEFRADLFNIFDNQTGYNLDPYVDNETFGKPRAQYNPRRFQLSVNLVF